MPREPPVTTAVPRGSPLSPRGSPTRTSTAPAKRLLARQCGVLHTCAQTSASTSPPRQLAKRLLAAAGRRCDSGAPPSLLPDALPRSTREARGTASLPCREVCSPMDPLLSPLLTPLQIGSGRLRNRIVV